MRQIDPTFKIEMPWDAQFEYIAKTYGYPFSLPSKSSIASFDVSEATRRSLVLCLTWFVCFLSSIVLYNFFLFVIIAFAQLYPLLP